MQKPLQTLCFYSSWRHSCQSWCWPEQFSSSPRWVACRVCACQQLSTVPSSLRGSVTFDANAQRSRGVLQNSNPAQHTCISQHLCEKSGLAHLDNQVARNQDECCCIKSVSCRAIWYPCIMLTWLHGLNYIKIQNSSLEI